MTALDATLLRALIEAGQASPGLWTIARWLTELGGAPVLWTVTVLAAALLWRDRRPRTAVSLVAIAATGRLGVEIVKAWTGRVRPDLIEHEVFTYSLSLPSGHAANSMLVYLGLALLATRGRPAAVAGVVVLSLLIGLTRPILGVHWPTDVLAGWLWGAGWALAAYGLAQRWLEGERVRPPSTSS